MISFFLKLRNKFRLLRSDVAVLYLASKDQRTPVTTKMLIGLTIVYFISPVDIVPDVIPLVGYVDELFVLPFLISTAVKTVPAPVLSDVRLKLAKSKRRVRNWLIAIFVLAICITLGYYGYEYWYKTDY